MKDTWVKRLEKIQKKLETLTDDLDLLTQAELAEVQAGNDPGMAIQMKMAIDKLDAAAYNLAMAKASAEGVELVGQMKADLDRLERAETEADE